MKLTFEIKDGDELSALRRLQSSDFLFQDEFTKASVYQLGDGRVIAYPAVGAKGIVAASEQAIREILAKGFPVMDTNPNPFQKNQELILHINQNVNSCLDQVSAGLDIDLNLSDTSAR